MAADITAKAPLATDLPQPQAGHSLLWKSRIILRKVQEQQHVCVCSGLYLLSFLLRTQSCTVQRNFAALMMVAAAHNPAVAASVRQQQETHTVGDCADTIPLASTAGVRLDSLVVGAESEELCLHPSAGFTDVMLHFDPVDHLIH